jgi:hypothetical protein
VKLKGKILKKNEDRAIWLACYKTKREICEKLMVYNYSFNFELCEHVKHQTYSLIVNNTFWKIPQGRIISIIKNQILGEVKKIGKYSY